MFAKLPAKLSLPPFFSIDLFGLNFILIKRAVSLKGEQKQIRNVNNTFFIQSNSITYFRLAAIKR